MSRTKRWIEQQAHRLGYHSLGAYLDALEQKSREWDYRRYEEERRRAEEDMDRKPPAA